MPTRWLDRAGQRRGRRRAGVLLGPEPLIGAQRIVLRLADQRIELATDGLGPFVGADADRARRPHAMSDAHPAQRGFTLIEVLVALAMVAITLGAGSRPPAR